MAGLLDEVNKAVSKIQESAKSVLDKTDIDEKIVEAAKDLKDKAQAALDKTDIDEKLADAAKELKNRAHAALEKTQVDDKLAEAAKNLKQVLTPTEREKDAMDVIKEEVAAQFDQIKAAAKGTDPIHDFMNRQNAPAAEAPAAEEPPEEEYEEE